MKIYSHRVDDTWTTSYRILENLSRNGNGEWNNDADGAEKGPARVGSKAISSRNGLTCTIESDKEKLNQAKLESDYNADPMFHKMSLAFDEGGAKGMLMNNLRVVPGSSTLVFSTNLELEGSETSPSLEAEDTPMEAKVEVERASHADIDKQEVSPGESMELEDRSVEEEKEHQPEEHETVDITAILLKSGITLAGLQEMIVSPMLDEYRSVLGVVPSSSGSFDTSGLNLTEFDSSIETERIKAPIAASEAEAVYAPDDNYGCDENYDYQDDDDENYDTPFYTDENANDDVFIHDNDAPRRKSLGASNEAVKCSTQKLNWNTIFSENIGDSNEDGNEDQASCNHDVNIPDIDVAIGNDYTFLNFSTLQSNSWAGARHWKFASARRPTKVPASTGEGQTSISSSAAKTSTGSNTSDTPKPQFLFDFGSTWSSNGAFDVPEESMSKHIKLHTLTKAALLKAAEIADEGTYELPVDAKLCPRDLCRLFSCNKMIVPPNTLKGILGKPRAISRIETLVSDYEDTCWGNIQPEVLEKINNFTRRNVNSIEESSGNRREDHDVYNDDYYDDDNDIGEDHYHDNHDDNNIVKTQKDGDPDVIGEEGGLQIRVPGMLQASRKIEKLNIGYSTISKRVNVKNLKADIWDWIDQECPTENIDTVENTDPNKDAKSKKQHQKRQRSTEKSEELASFQNMVSNVAKSNQQGEGQEISVSYYFLCLLHLANENNLKIEGQQNFADLKIQKAL